MLRFVSSDSYQLKAIEITGLAWSLIIFFSVYYVVDLTFQPNWINKSDQPLCRMWFENFFCMSFFIRRNSTINPREWPVSHLRERAPHTECRWLKNINISRTVCLNIYPMLSISIQHYLSHKSVSETFQTVHERACWGFLGISPESFMLNLFGFYAKRQH